MKNFGTRPHGSENIKKKTKPFKKRKICVPQRLKRHFGTHFLHSFAERVSRFIRQSHYTLTLIKLIMNTENITIAELESTISRIIEGYRQEAYLTIEKLMFEAFRHVGILLEGNTSTLTRKPINGISAQTLKDIAGMPLDGLAFHETSNPKRRSYMLEFIKARSLTFEATRLKYPNYLKPWKEEDDQELERLWREGVSVNDIAVMFMRNPGAIKSRIEKLGLADKYGD